MTRAGQAREQPASQLTVLETGPLLCYVGPVKWPELSRNMAG